ncbi:MAG: ATP-binding cassette domain-containing protein [Candidatus Ancillula sp.]|jgi:putative ABC transport system ATP-binding protein|nr:ATP-binding cassette domain-containing protein [Candidatus Ancillula sp.]
MKLEIKNGQKKFRDKLVFDNINEIFSEGEVVAITGQSGAGKTTLLNCLGLLEPLDQGDILLNNKKINNEKEKAKRNLFRNVFGFLFQNYGLIDDLTVSENLEFSLEYKKLNKKEKNSMKLEALKKVGLEKSINSKIYELSGGEQQRVALAKLIIKNPKIIFCDEPSAALDEDNTKMVLSVLDEFSKKGCIVLISSHDPLVVNACSRSILLGSRK